MSWVSNVLVAIDQLGNAIAGGNPDSTISARVGYFANKEPCSFKDKCILLYWKTMEWIIDLAFLPIDGPGHCLQAYQNDSEEKFMKGSDWARVVLSLIIIPSCLLIFVFLRLMVLIVPKWKYQPK